MDQEHHEVADNLKIGDVWRFRETPTASIADYTTVPPTTVSYYEYKLEQIKTPERSYWFLRYVQLPIDEIFQRIFVD